MGYEKCAFQTEYWPYLGSGERGPRLLSGWPQGLESPWKNAHFSRAWKVLENGI